MAAHVLIVSLNIKSIKSKKNGFISHFVKTGSMKAVFTNYSYIIYCIIIVFFIIFP